MARVILHIDMDAFYASIEQRDRPETKGLPVIVGGSPDRRGVVCAASYEARKFGVRSAMPSRTAGRLCPEGIFIRPRMDHYRDESRAIFRLVAETGVTVEQVSVDEAYLDASLLTADSDPDLALCAAVPLGKQIKKSIWEERRLTASVGIASNKMLAKLGSDFAKPNGLTLIPERDKVSFLRPMPARSIHGVGKVTEEALARAGLKTIGDLQDYPGDLRSLVGSWGPTLKRYAFGDDDRPLDLGDDIKSISSESTFDRDTDDRPFLRASLREQSDDIAARLRKRNLEARTVQVKVRYGNFTTLTRQASVEDPIADAREIYRMACWLLGRDKLVSRPLRLLGLGVSGLSESSAKQLVLPLTKR